MSLSEAILYVPTVAVLKTLQLLPLSLVALIGRTLGVIYYFADARHRIVAIRNIAASFPEKTLPEVRAIARENFRRIGENFACTAKTGVMEFSELQRRVTAVGVENVLPEPTMSPQSVVLAIGHFGAFDLWARFGQVVPAFQTLTTYRGLKQPALNQLLLSLRENSGCRFFDRRTESGALRSAIQPTGTLLGLLSDQGAIGNALKLPFFGRDCAVSPAPAIFALRFNCRLLVGICYRVGLARWRLEVHPEIPTRVHGGPRSAAAIMNDINRIFEAAVRRDPANWFWVHNRWKHLPKGARAKLIPDEPLAGPELAPDATSPAA
jgi:KDO2-lipid IV(A) lauroyltransferase